MSKQSTSDLGLMTGGTLRQQMISALQRKAMDQRELSQALGIQEKEVVLHLPHIAKSAKAKKLKWQIQPAYCEACNYSFKDRKRLSPPSKCPRCRSSRIQGPWYRIAG
jgi:transcriptional regulator